MSVRSIAYLKDDYIWNRATCHCENDKYLEKIVDDSVITRDETIDAKTKLSFTKI